MKGFTLIECLIVLVIIGILTAVSMPIYSIYIKNERRFEAEVALEQLAARLETYFTIHNTYQHATFENLNISSFASNHHYQLHITTSDTDFTLEAIPDEGGDSICGTLTLNASGEKGINGNSSINDCW